MTTASVTALQREIGKVEAGTGKRSRLQFVSAGGEAGFELEAPEAALKKMEEALSDDLNPAAALACLQEAVTTINANLSRLSAEALKRCIEFFTTVDRLTELDIASAASIPENVKAALAQYVEARKARDFTTSDLMRQKIVALGWLVKDGRPGEPSTVKKARRAWDIKK